MHYICKKKTEKCLKKSKKQLTVQRIGHTTGLINKKIENVTLSNVYIEAPGGETDDMKNFSVPENEKRYPENNMYGKLPAYGLYCRHCDGLTLNNVNFKAINEDKREALIFEDVI